MGVHGLWNIIDSVGHPVKVTALEGKRLGVDANIWLYKFIRGFREKDTSTSIESHKLGLFNRICKLLANKIKPVFVFDGPAPVLKRKTLERRENVRNKHLEKLQDAAMRLFAQQIKEQYPDAKVDDIPIQLPALRSHGLVAAEKLTDEDRELFYLPPEVIEYKSDEEDDNLDEFIHIDKKPDVKKVKVDQHAHVDEDYFAGYEIEAGSIDIHSKDFESMPAEVRYEILQDIKDSKRKLRRREALPEDASDFSSLQLQRLREKRSIQEKIEKCEKDICSMYTGEINGQTVKSYRMQSDATSTMLYIRNVDGTEVYDPTLINSQQAGPSHSDNPAPVSKDKTLEKRENVGDKHLEQQPNADTRLFDKQIEAEIDYTTIQSPILKSHGSVTADKLTEEDREFSHLSSGVIELKSDEEDDVGKEKSVEHVNIDDENFSDCDLGTKTILINSRDSDNMYEEVHCEILQDLKDTQKSTNLDEHLEKLQDSDTPLPVQQIEEQYPDAKVNDKPIQSPAPKPHSLVAAEKLTDEDREFSHLSSGVIELKSDEEDDLILTDEEPDVEKAKVDKHAHIDEDYSDAKVNDNPVHSPISRSHGLVAAEKLTDEDRELFHHSNEVIELISDEEEDDLDDLIQIEKEPDIEKAEVDKNIRKESSSPKEIEKELVNQVQRESQETIINSQPAGPSYSQFINATSQPHSNSTNRVSNKIVEEAKELLRLFGIPYIDAAGEAEAQCALLESLKLTEGTITDDSDVWLFGAQNVYRHFFNDDNYITHYKMTDIEFHVRLNRDNLVCFAMLVGSDYTDGIMNVGPVTALEILSEFPGDSMEPLIKFKDWREKCNRTKNLKPGSKKRQTFLKFKLPEEFPSRAVFEGYTRPMADSSTEQFVWGMPELDELREYARRNFAWDSNKIDDRLLPVMKKLSERKTQMTIDTFFFKTPANQDPERFRSKRVNQALNKIAKTTESEVVDLSEEEDEDDDDGEEVDVAKKKRPKEKKEVKQRKTSGRGKSAKEKQQVAETARGKKKEPKKATSSTATTTTKRQRKARI